MRPASGTSTKGLRAKKAGKAMKDTDPAVEAMQQEFYRGLTGGERLALAFEMSELARELALTRLRAAHPDWTERRCKLELIRYSLPGGQLPEGLA